MTSEDMIETIRKHWGDEITEETLEKIADELSVPSEFIEVMTCLDCGDTQILIDFGHTVRTFIFSASEPIVYEVEI